MDRGSAGLHPSVVTVAEAEDDIAESRGPGARRKAERVSGWPRTPPHFYGSRALPIAPGTARGVGDPADRARGPGQAPGSAAPAIAATARKHGDTILVRDLRHFGAVVVPALDPFEAPPADVVSSTPTRRGAGSAAHHPSVEHGFRRRADGQLWSGRAGERTSTIVHGAAAPDPRRNRAARAVAALKPTSKRG